MSQRELKNVPASVRARLLSEARASGDSYDQVLQYFAIERFLYRLSQTKWADRLIVKGAIMLRAWGTPLGRPTRDIDFLGSIDRSPATVERTVRECLAVEYPSDGLVFDQSVEIAEINVAAADTDAEDIEITTHMWSRVARNMKSSLIFTAVDTASAKEAADGLAATA